MTALLLLPLVAFAQGRFTVNGRLKIEGADLTGARVVVLKNGTKERTISANLNKFTLDLDLNANYVLSFEKDGFVSKKISFNTKAPSEAIANGFTPFDFAVSLFKQYDDINIVVFNQPVGMIRFDDKTGDFDYDTDYTKSIQSQLQQVFVQVEQKQKEEAVSAKAAEVKAAEEAKAKAKAEAEAAKQATAKAKADAEAERQAQAQAKAVEKKREEPAPPKTRAVVDKKEEPVIVETPSSPKPIAEPKPRAVAPQPVPERAASKGKEGADQRRSTTVVVKEEPRPTARARPQVKEESRPEEYMEGPEPQRSQRMIVEQNTVTVLVTVEQDNRKDEYRKVIHKWGGQFFFKNGATCSEEIYQREAQAEQMAGAVPRGKLD